VKRIQPSEIFFRSPLGWIRIEGGPKGIEAIDFCNIAPRSSQKSLEAKSLPVLRETMHQLQEYFGGQRKQFTFRMNLKGTAFQKKVWSALQRIPYGEVRSYETIAYEMGNPRAVRAVGMANSRNPIGIAIPCHRVIGKDGMLVGYAAGIERKLWLLEHEGVRLIRRGA